MLWSVLDTLTLILLQAPPGACGHEGQIASMMRSSNGAQESGAMEFLSGTVTFFLGAPAEESHVEIEYREKLRREGKIKFLGCKQELHANKFFHNIDMAMMVHMAALGPRTKVVLMELLTVSLGNS